MYLLLCSLLDTFQLLETAALPDLALLVQLEALLADVKENSKTVLLE